MSTTTTTPACLTRNPIYINTPGLVHYWPFCDLSKDIVGNADLYGGINASLTFDRFNNPNSALSLKNGFLMAPPGIYFNGSDFSITAWVKVRVFNNWSRVVDFGLLIFINYFQTKNFNI